MNFLSTSILALGGRTIKRLKDTGMLLRDIKYYSELRYEGDGTMEERMELLARHRKSVVEERNKWNEYLRNLDEKIGIYQKRIEGDWMQKAGFSMELELADCSVKVAEIVEKTVKAIYPHYYPDGAVQFFLDLHNEHRIREALDREAVYLAVVQGEIVGTGSIRENEICRLFILPEYQGKGYGSRLMDLLEEKVFRQYQAVHIDASFPAESMYLKRGYQITSYEKIKTENGDFLCYHTMEKAMDTGEEICRN